MVSTHDRSDRWIRGFGTQPAGARARVLCLPHAGGAASFYHPLASRLTGAGEPAEVFVVQYPGRQDRRGEPPLESIEELANSLFEEMKGWTDLPLVLFGHSMGAVIGYELCRRLESATDTPPLGLIVSGRRAPSVHIEDRIHEGGDSALIAELKQLSGTADGILDDEEVLAMVLPALRADYRAIETYRQPPGPELACPIRALAGESDHRALLADVRAWERHTTGSFEMRVFPGGHFYLSDQWPDVADAVRTAVTAFLDAPDR